jgi:hypothetical protein
LFERGRHIELTAAGRALLEQAGRVPWSGGNEGVVVMLSDVLGAGR